MAPLTPQQLEQRRSGIGSSDIAAICGLSRWAAPIDVFLDKVNGTNNVANTIPLRMGHALEPLIAELYAERTTHTLEQCGTIVHPVRTWQLATPDRLAHVITGARKVVECKKAWDSNGWGEEGTDQVPPDYLVQVQWQLDVTGLYDADIAVLMGHRFAIYSVRRDDELCAQLRDAAENFWRAHVLTKEPPPVDGSEGFKRYLSDKYGTHDRTVLDADEHMESVAAKLESVVRDLGRLEKEEARLKNLLREFIGDSYAVKGACWKATWGKCKDGKKVDWEAVAKAAGATDALIAQHTAPKPGHRTLRFTWKYEE